MFWITAGGDLARGARAEAVSICLRKAGSNLAVPIGAQLAVAAAYRIFVVAAQWRAVLTVGRPLRGLRLKHLRTSVLQRAPCTSEPAEFAERRIVAVVARPQNIAVLAVVPGRGYRQAELARHLFAAVMSRTFFAPPPSYLAVAGRESDFASRRQMHSAWPRRGGASSRLLPGPRKARG